MTKTLFAITLVLIISITTIVRADSNQECPEGTYNIGISKTDEPLCKIIPTGCPHGDSIPMEKCNTFETPEDQTTLVPFEQEPVEQEPVVIEMDGK